MKKTSNCLTFPRYVETSLKLQRRKFFFPRGYQPHLCYHLPIYQAKVVTSVYSSLFSCVRANCRNKMARKLGANIRRWLVRLFTASSEWGFSVVRCANTRTTQTSLQYCRKYNLRTIKMDRNKNKISICANFAFLYEFKSLSWQSQIA